MMVATRPGRHRKYDGEWRVLFERVPFLPLSQDGLNYPGTFTAPAREIESSCCRQPPGPCWRR